tara:strand:- start:710 stop:1552 length:843 start_codon:yes stop_codon:yes gene_type:complete
MPKIVKYKTCAAVTVLVYLSSELVTWKPRDVDSGVPGVLWANVSVCVPAIPVDYEDGDLMRLLRSVKMQFLKPKEVVVALSGVSELYAKEIRRELSSVAAPVRLVLTAVSVARSPGQNRNRAMQYASGDVISFFDADDIMHPRRVSIITEAFAVNPALKIVLHGLTSPERPWRQVVTYATVRKWAGGKLCDIERLSRNLGQEWMSSKYLQFDITHGHSSIHRTVAENYEFTDELTGEDCKFVRTILRDLCASSNRDHSSLLLDFPFSKYTPRARKRVKTP